MFAPCDGLISVLLLHLNDVDVVLLVYRLLSKILARAQKLLICMSLKDVVMFC